MIGGRNTCFFFVVVVVFLASLGLCCCTLAFSSFREQGLSLVRGLLVLMASVVTEQGSRATRLQSLPARA